MLNKIKYACKNVHTFTPRSKSSANPHNYVILYITIEPFEPFGRPPLSRRPGPAPPPPPPCAGSGCYYSLVRDFSASLPRDFSTYLAHTHSKHLLSRKPRRKPGLVTTGKGTNLAPDPRKKGWGRRQLQPCMGNAPVSTWRAET